MNLQKGYNWIVASNTTSLNHVVTNSKGQKIEFYEYPVYGDGAAVVAVCHELKLAGVTDFYDCDDFYEDSEYLPVFDGEVMKCEHEM